MPHTEAEVEAMMSELMTVRGKVMELVDEVNKYRVAYQNEFRMRRNLQDTLRQTVQLDLQDQCKQCPECGHEGTYDHHEVWKIVTDDQGQRSLKRMGYSCQGVQA